MTYATYIAILVIAGLSLLLSRTNAQQGYSVDFNPNKRFPSPPQLSVGMDGVAQKAACVWSEEGVKVSAPVPLEKRRPIEAHQEHQQIELIFRYEAKQSRELAVSEEKPIKLRKRWWGMNDREFASHCGISYVQAEEGILRKTTSTVITFKSEPDASDFFRALDEDDPSKPSAVIEAAVTASGAKIENISCFSGEDDCLRILDRDEELAVSTGLSEANADFIPLRVRIVPFPDFRVLKARGPLE